MPHSDSYKSEYTQDTHPELFKDIRELCTCCVTAIVQLSQKHQINPLMVSKIFIEVFNKVIYDVDQSQKERN